MRWRGDLKHSPVPAPEDLCTFSDDIKIRQYAAAVGEELLAFCGQDESPTHVVKEPETKLLLKIS
jgi:hypothetical protein